MVSAAFVAPGQTPSGTSSSGQTSAGTSGQSQTGATGQINSQPTVTVPGAPGVIVNDPAGVNQNAGLIPGGDTNRIPFGGTNQVRFGRTNPGAIIQDPSGVNVPPQVPFGTTNQIQFGTNQGVQLPTGNTPSAGSGAIPTSGAEVNQRGAFGATNQVSAANDALFAQQLNTALARGGATKVFFPQTRSTITIVNQNGSIMLQGFVSSEAERQQIEARVKNSAGVTSVNNQLKIGAPGQNRAISPLPNTPANENERRLLNP